MGKAKALRLGITKGIAHTIGAVLPKEWSCPICHLKFIAEDVAKLANDTGVSPEEIVAGHVKDCITRVYPNRKSECLMCKEKGKTTRLLISELDEHIAKEHPEN